MISVFMDPSFSLWMYNLWGKMHSPDRSEMALIIPHPPPVHTFPVSAAHTQALRASTAHFTWYDLQIITCSTA